MQIVERIKSVASKQGYTLAELEQKLGFGVRTIYKWDKNAPSVEKVLAVANFLNISLSWLITGKTEDPSLSETFLENYKQLSAEEKETINHYMEICLCRTYTPQEVPSRQTQVPILGQVASPVPWEYAKLLGYATTILDADYAMIMADNSMSPMFSVGDTLYIKQDTLLNSGDIGIFLKNQQIVCRQYLDFEDTIILRPFHPDYAEEKFKKSDAQTVRLIGKVVLN